MAASSAYASRLGGRRIAGGNELSADSVWVLAMTINAIGPTRKVASSNAPMARTTRPITADAAEPARRAIACGQPGRSGAVAFAIGFGRSQVVVARGAFGPAAPGIADRDLGDAIG